MSDSSGFQVDMDAPRHYHEQVARFMLPLAEALVAVAVKRDDVALDVACGTGFATRIAAGAAGSGGSVVGADINAGMVEFARSIPTDAVEISWDVASALDLPYGNATFGSVISNQGIQFFPSVVDGLRALPWSGSFFELDETVRDSALNSVEDELSDYATEHGFDVPFRSYLAIATV